MLRRYWCIGIAAVILLISSSNNAHSQEKASAKNTTANEQSQVANPETPTDSSAKAIAEAAVKIERALGDKITENGQTQAERDLNAQEDMALWALIMAIATIITTGVSVYVAIIVRRTLSATAAAVNTQVASERPHVRFFRTIKRTNKKGQLITVYGVNFRNYGRTPALVKSLSIKYALSKDPPLPSSAGEPRIYPDDAVMAQDEEWPRKHYIPPWDGDPDLGELVKLHNVDKKRLFVFGILTYVDAFGETRKTGFCRVFGGKYFGFNQGDVDGQSDLNYTT